MDLLTLPGNDLCEDFLTLTIEFYSICPCGIEAICFDCNLNHVAQAVLSYHRSNLTELKNIYSNHSVMRYAFKCNANQKVDMECITSSSFTQVGSGTFNLLLPYHFLHQKTHKTNEKE